MATMTSRCQLHHVSYQNFYAVKAHWIWNHNLNIKIKQCQNSVENCSYANDLFLCSSKTLNQIKIAKIIILCGLLFIYKDHKFQLNFNVVLW